MTDLELAELERLLSMPWMHLNLAQVHYMRALSGKAVERIRFAEEAAAGENKRRLKRNQAEVERPTGKETL